MTNAMVLDSSRVMNGSYGECWVDGTWQTNINHVETTVEFDKEEIKRSGTRWTGHKVIGVKGSGTISGYHITSTMQKAAAAAALDDRAVPYITEIISKLDDPEAYGAERVRYKNVSFDEVPVSNFEAQAVVEEEWPFTFEGLEFLDSISA